MTYEQALQKLKHIPRLIITVSGDIGAGKSTFAKRLAEELEIPRIYIGQFMREEAAKRGVTLDTLNKLLDQDDALDRHLDEMQRERSEHVERAVFEGRTSWHFVKDPTVKVYLAVNPEIATERIWEDRNDKRDKYGTKDVLHTANEERKQSEIKRYEQYYGIDAYDKSNFDIVVDTSDINIQEVFEAGVIAIAEVI